MRSWSGYPQCTFSLRPARPLMILWKLSVSPLEGWTSVLNVPSVAVRSTRPLMVLRSWSGCLQRTFILKPARLLIMILRSLSGCPECTFSLRHTRPLNVLEEIVWLSPEAAVICPQCTFSCFETQKAAHDLEELVCLSSGGAVICPQLPSVAVRPTRSLMILRSWSGCLLKRRSSVLNVTSV